MENKPKSSRRSFLKLGVVAAVVVAAGGAIYRSRNPKQHEKHLLDGEAKIALHAIVLTMLQNALPASGPERESAAKQAINNVEIAISGLPYHAQKEVADLFGLLSLGLARRLLTGISSGWSEAQAQEVGAFLQNWRLHSSETFQSGYHALHDLILGPFYGNPANWQSIGYPGPLKELSQ